MGRQRLRGFIGTTLAACMPWTALGLLAGIAFQFDLIPGVHGALGRPVPGGFLTVGVFVGAIVGVINGIAFSTLLVAAERGKRVEDLRSWRFATWGAVATAGALGVLIQSPLAAAIGAVVGAGGALVTLSLARRTLGSPRHTASLSA